MKTAGIYIIVHAESGRGYVGSSVDVPSRLRAHRNLLRHGRHHNSHLQRAWNKYGASAFSFEQLEAVSEPRDLGDREQARLDALRPNVYNVGRFTGSPLLGVKRTFTPEWRERLRVAARRRGRTQSFEAMSAARKGQPKSSAHRAAIGAANRIAHARPETRERMRAAARQREAIKRRERQAAF